MNNSFFNVKKLSLYKHLWVSVLGNEIAIIVLKYWKIRVLGLVKRAFNFYIYLF